MSIALETQPTSYLHNQFDQAHRPITPAYNIRLNVNFNEASTDAQTQANNRNIQATPTALNNDSLQDLGHRIEDAGYNVTTLADGMQNVGGGDSIFSFGFDVLGVATDEVRSVMDGPQQTQAQQLQMQAPTIDPTPLPYHPPTLGMGA